ncbi:MAG: hypothetical protein U5R46_12250 [Gammaproteobacteria bacterium]|nr:hypothetical protein [Gammaproteobacteria bacterium]
MRSIGLSRVAGAALAFWLMPSGAVFSAHYLGHMEGGGLSQQEVDVFCKQYPALIKSPNFNKQDRPKYEKLYKQHCDQPAAKPIQPAEPDSPGKQPPTRQGRIDHIQPPGCLGRGSEIHVRGENLRDGGLDCRLEAGGQRQSLQAYSRTAREYRFRLSHLQPGPDYVLQCDVDGDRQRLTLKGCAEPGAPVQASDVDLAAEIRAGVLRPGETQMVEVLIPNRGQSRVPRNERYRVRLALVDRDLTRTVVMAMGGRGMLLEKDQWAMRVPAGGQSERLSMAMNVPGNLAGPTGLYWCAVADSDGQIPEANERNNLACVPVSGGPQTAERDDLSKLFGSAVRNKNPGVQVPEADLTGDAPDGPLGTRQYIADEDVERPALASGGSPSDRQTLPAVQDRVADLPAVQADRVSESRFADSGMAHLEDLGGIEDAATDLAALPGIEGLGDGSSPMPDTGLGGSREEDDKFFELLDELNGDDANDIFGGMGFMPEATTPRRPPANAGPASSGSAGRPPVTPPSPRGAMGGAASTDPVTDKTTTEEPGANGTTVYTTRTTFKDGSTETRQENWGPNDQLNYRRVIRTNAEGRVVQDRVRGSHHRIRGPGPLDPSGNPDPNAPTEAEAAWARWLYEIGIGRRIDFGIKNPNDDYVNPGPDGATPDPDGPRLILPEHQLVGNPSPEDIGSGERPLSEADAERFRKELEEKIAGPGGHPGDGEGGPDEPLGR